MDLSKLELVDLPPHAANLIEGLRDFGYSLETSIADIIDNSITAKASRINIITDTISDDPSIAIVDNGIGMSKEELLDALRPGTKNPLEHRRENDLGRFGLGLKSASFSQCRQLIVVTKKNGIINGAAWDLDIVAKTNKWSAVILDNPEFLLGVNQLEESGTAVIWKRLDRLEGSFKNDAAKRTKNLNALISAAETHQRLVFHRFLKGSVPRLKIYLNNVRLAPIDPFAENHPARQVEPIEELKLKNGLVTFKCVTIPHHKKMTQIEWDEIGGPDGHLRSQGLYIFRSDRLIIAGGWLGLAKQTEATKLCRIAIDIPNSMDSDWKIDVKKASAQLPPIVRDKLKKIVERFVSVSRRTYARKGRKLISEDQVPVWNRVMKDDKIIFKPDLEHPALSNFRKRLSEEQKNDFDACIRLIGASLPVDTIHADIIGSAEKIYSDQIDDYALELQIKSLIETYLNNGIAKEAISELLRQMVLINENWLQAEPIINKYLEVKK